MNTTALASFGNCMATFTGAIHIPWPAEVAAGFLGPVGVIESISDPGESSRNDGYDQWPKTTCTAGAPYLLLMTA